MNKQEKDYAISRVNEILKEKITAVEEKYTTKCVHLDDEQRLEALRQGRFEIRAYDKDSYHGWPKFVTFHGERPAVVDKESISKEVSELKKKATKIKDELILGDCEEAIKLLNDFSKD